MRWIGLTGGIACGKSTVSASLRAKGFSVIDADLLAREVVQAGTSAHREIAQVFGSDAIGDDGQLNRAKVASVVFNDRSMLERLERIIHPLVRERVAQIKVELTRKKMQAAFYDVPLLFEKAMQASFDLVVVVSCRPEIQLARLMARNSLSEAEARTRLAAQLPLRIKETQAHHVILNNGDIAALEIEISRVLGEIGLSHQGQT